MSLHRASVLIPRRIFLLGVLGMALSASAQYPGQVGKKSKDTVELARNRGSRMDGRRRQAEGEPACARHGL